MDKKKRISFIYKGKKFNINAIDCNHIGKIFGLMFRSRRMARALLFSFEKPTKIKIHSLFVFFPFLVLWLDKKNIVIKIRIVNPFNLSISPKKYFRKIIEIPFNKNYKKLINTLTS